MISLLMGEKYFGWNTAACRISAGCVEVLWGKSALVTGGVLKAEVGASARQPGVFVERRWRGPCQIHQHRGRRNAGKCVMFGKLEERSRILTKRKISMLAKHTELGPVQ